MKTIEISETITKRCPGLRLHCLECNSQVTVSDDILQAYINAEIREIAGNLTIQDITAKIPVKATRTGYKALGKDPSRYRPSAESLLRRIVKGQELYLINNVIDILNLVSIRSGYSIGGYDFDKIEGTIRLKCGKENMVYTGIGRGLLNIAGLPVLLDEQGPFGTPTSDSERTSITLKTRRFLMVFYNFETDASIEKWIEQTKFLLTRFASATGFEYYRI